MVDIYLSVHYLPQFVFQDKGTSNLFGNWTTIAQGIGKGTILDGEGPYAFESSTVPGKVCEDYSTVLYYCSAPSKLPFTVLPMDR